MSAPSSQSLPQAPWRVLLECIAAGFAVGLAATIVLALVVILFDTAGAAASPQEAGPITGQVESSGTPHGAAPGLHSTELRGATSPARRGRRVRHADVTAVPLPARAQGLDLALAWVLLLSGIGAVLLLGGRRR